MELIVDNITKKIKSKTILDQISLHLSSGRVYGVVGENGSGKTMLFRAISGLIRIDEGSVSWNGQLLHKDIARIPNLGIVIENAGLYPELTGVKNLKLLAGINKKIGEKEIREAIERVGLDPDDKRTFRKYSLGMKQRLMIAQAIMEKPDLILLDEPTNGLDEKGVELIRNIILEEKARGALVMIASHNKDDIRIVADETYRIDAGRIQKEVQEL